MGAGWSLWKPALVSLPCFSRWRGLWAPPWGFLEEEVLESPPVDAGTRPPGPPAVFSSGSLARVTSVRPGWGLAGLKGAGGLSVCPP